MLATVGKPPARTQAMVGNSRYNLQGYLQQQRRKQHLK